MAGPGATALLCRRPGATMPMPILERLEQNRTARITIKVLAVLLATFGSTVVFGFFLPFFLLAMDILPSLGVGGVVYLLAGGAFGLLFGATSTAVSLATSPRLFTRYFVWLVGVLLLLSVAFGICWMAMQERFAHV